MPLADEQDKESQKLRAAGTTMYNDFVRQIQLFRDFDVVDAVKRLLGYSEEPETPGIRGTSGGGGGGTGKIWSTFTFH